MDQFAQVRPPTPAGQPPPVALSGNLQTSAWRVTFAAFVCTFLCLFVLKANHFVLSLDEGIFLDGGRRILAGQVPYRDFFILMGPGSFWLQAAAFRLFGTTLMAAHLVMILDVSILASCVCWLVALTTNRAAYAGWTTLAFVILQTADLGLTLPNHRWDSAAFAMLAITIAASSASRGWIAFAGLCAAFAAWITPTVGLLIPTIVVMLWLAKSGCLKWFAAGCTITSLVCGGVLALEGALGPMMQQMLWTGSNYSAANYMPYGSRLGGYGQFFEAQGAVLIGQVIMLFGLTLPVILPPLAFLLHWKTRPSRPTVPFLLACGAALVAATYPRMDARHLTYAAPVFFALSATLLTRLPAAPGWRILRTSSRLSVACLAGIFGLYTLVATFSQTSTVHSPVGDLRVSSDDRALLQQLDRAVPRASRTFVYPYLPVAYFLTLSDNPTRFSYLQPGMMNALDEATAMGELRQHPPTHVIYFDLPEQEILRIWSGSDPARLHMKLIEGYLSEHYTPKSTIPHTMGTIRILELKPDLQATGPLSTPQAGDQPQ